MYRQVVTKLMEMESLPRMRYGLVTYGENADTAVKLDDFVDKSKLIGFISQISQPQTGGNYEDGILKALQMFTEQGKPHAERTIMLFTNSRSGTDPSETAGIRDQLSESRTRLIIVDVDSVGDDIKRVAPSNDDIVPVSSGDDLNQITKDVTTVVVKGIYFLALLMYLLTL